MNYNWWERKPSIEPTTRPALRPYPTPAEPGPEGGTDIPDLRAVLLELNADRARLRRNRDLFQKETERFEQALDSLPAWLVDMYHLTPRRRCSIAFYWAKRFHLTDDCIEGDKLWLEPSETGRKWLTLSAEEQYACVFKLLREGNQPHESNMPGGVSQDDRWFLGVPVLVVPVKPEKRTYFEMLNPAASSLEQRQVLRESLFSTFRELPLGVFHRFDEFASHVCFGLNNPLLLGRQSDEVGIWMNGRIVLPREQSRYDTGRYLLGQFVSNRLISMGCLQAGVASDGELMIARRPRLDTYFGHEPPAEEQLAEVHTTRVVVQPDFSVLVIGVNSSILADLLPFCERQRGGSGATMLHLTRSSIVKARTAGLSGETILERLRRHSSKPLPDNVVHEVREWSDWLRIVSTESAMLFHCPDSIAADRVVAALGRKAGKVNETTVAIASTFLDENDRRTLLEHGIYIRRENS
jgi:hypothetical protein